MFLQAEEDVDARSNWAGCWVFQSEVRDGLTLDGVFLVFQGEDNLGDTLKPLDRGIRGEEGVADKNTNYWSRRNWTVLGWPVHLVCRAL